MTSLQPEEDRIRKVYEQRKELARARLYSPLVPSALFAMQVRERVLLKILSRFVSKPLSECRLLDVGCGKGDELTTLIRYGFTPARLYGIDIMEERVAEARAKHPDFEIVLGNATQMPWDDGFFDVLLQYTVFSSILDRGVLRDVAAEMLRLLAPGGIIISYDMRVTRPDNPDVIPMRKRDLRELFPGAPVHYYATTLAPPIARRLASLSWLSCELLYMIPWLRTHYLAVIQKPR